jgi:hypothetical protein
MSEYGLPTPEDNLPYGVRSSDPYFNPETCPGCGDELDENGTCPDPACSSYGEAPMTAEDAADEAADHAFESAREDDYRN